MSVTLLPETQSEIQRLVDSGRYPNADAAVQSAIRLLNEQYEEKLEKLRELVREGFESPSLGELTDELWDEIDRRAEERFQRGEQPGPHVCP